MYICIICIYVYMYICIYSITSSISSYYHMISSYRVWSSISSWKFIQWVNYFLWTWINDHPTNMSVLSNFWPWHIPGSARHVPGRKCRKRDMAYGNSWWVGRSDLKWNEIHEMNELTWIKWHEWIEMNDSKRMSWNERIVMNDLTWVNSHEWTDMNPLRRMNRNEWIKIKDLSTSSWKSGPNPSVFCDSNVKWSSRYSLVHIVSISSSKSGPSPSVFSVFFCEIELSLQSRAHFVDHFPDRAAKPAETDTLQRRPQTATLPTGFCARESF